jgi:hypothetical protein
VKNFVLGCVFGIVIATVGFAGIASLIDNSVTTFQQMIKSKASQ